MKHLIYLLFLALLCLPEKMSAEGSVDFVEDAGHRLMIRTDVDQQIKVYAAAGEFINFGTSHLNIEGGYAEIYQPDGTLFGTYDGTDEIGIIHDNVQELNGPTGGAGYEPIVVEVADGMEGIWSVIFKYPVNGFAPWINILNSAPWTREVDQPTTRRSILAWDVTVSQGSAANAGGTMLKGRVYSNEYNSMISQNGTTTSPTFYVQTYDGFLYQVDFNEADPFGFPLFSNLLGITDVDNKPTYQSNTQDAVTRTLDVGVGGEFFIYEPQAQDEGLMINNKLFFNIPNEDLPEEAMTTDIFRGNTHMTWLLPAIPDLTTTVDSVSLSGTSASGDPCLSSVFDVNGENFISFITSSSQTVEISLDLNGNGIYGEDVDWTATQFFEEGSNTLPWNGQNNLGEPVPEQQLFNLSYQLRLRGGETHILMQDVENNLGGVAFTLLTDLGVAETNQFYYDHSSVDGPVSGGGTPGNPLPTTEPFTYEESFGNMVVLDYWVNVSFNEVSNGALTFISTDDCTTLSAPDSDGDGIIDTEDIDDDNDGVSDLAEGCNSTSFACLPGGLDPSGDEDMDGIPNYVDPDVTMCTDTVDGGFMCRTVPAIYDTDGDNIPDHLDLDSDNDGITDLYEARHGMVDANGDGVIDGVPADFGANGLFNALASDPDALDALANYQPFDKDGDSVKDIDDLDSDNDGIYDVLEAQLYFTDEDDDGRIGDGSLAIYVNGIVEILAFERTGLPIPNPRDHDGDLVPDFHDLDTDNDLIVDALESGQTDADGDAMIGIAPLTVDGNGVAMTDADGMPQTVTSFPFDVDGDVLHDFRDLDSDNDLIYDVIESGVNGVAIDPDLDGIGGMGVPVVDEEGNGLIKADADGTVINTTSNPADNDGDGLFTFRDLDSDNDGLNDILEAVQVNLDADNDGFAGTSPVTVDARGVAVADAEITLPAIAVPYDKDTDEIHDWLDLDSDNDLITDCEEARNDDPDSDGRVGTGIPPINDKGQVVQADDTPISTSIQTDKDTDTVPDFRDLDSDNDGINDVYEGGLVAGVDPDNDGIAGMGVPMVDPNGLPMADGTGAPLTPVYMAVDIDGDMTPDYLDLDTDNDGINDAEEAGHPDPDNDGYVGTGVPPVNADGQPEDAGTPISSSTPQDFDADTYPDFRDLDADNDGINDVEEAGFPDEDNDGIVGTGTPPVNEDGQVDGVTSDPRDTDGDGIPDYHDHDSDGDGLLDVFEAGFDDPDNDGQPGTGTPDVNDQGQTEGGTSNPQNTDGDEMPDYIDLDSDNDEFPDMDECIGGFDCPDSDGDGIIDPWDISCYHPDGTVSITEVSGAGIFCEGTDITMSGQSNSDGPFTFTWEGPNGFNFTDNSNAGETLNLALNGIVPSQEGTYSLFGVTLDGCVTEPLSVLIEVNPRPAVPALTSDTELACTGEAATLTSTTANGTNVTYVWSQNDAVVAETASPILEFAEVTPAETGIYSVMVIDNECESNISNPIELAISDNTEADDDNLSLTFNETSTGFNILENDYIDGNAEVTLTIITEPQLGTLVETSRGMFDYTPNPNAYGTDIITYELCNTYCPDDCDRATFRIDIDSKDENGDCFYVNIFTPNDDNSNDALIFPCLDDTYRENKLMVFNRWGDKVFEQENYQNDWKGTHNGQNLPPATYFYIIELGEGNEPVQGYVSIMR